MTIPVLAPELLAIVVLVAGAVLVLLLVGPFTAQPRGATWVGIGTLGVAVVAVFLNAPAPELSPIRLVIVGVAIAGAVALLLVLGACDKARPPSEPAPIPSAPAPAPVPSAPVPVPVPPTPALTRYHASGTVTDAAGSPMANVSVEVTSAPAPGGEARVIRNTDGAGHYEFYFEPARPLYNAQGPAARILAFTTGYQANEQYVSWGATDVVKNLRLHPVPTVDAGHSVTVSIEPDHSICSDQEDWLVLDHRCEQFDVRVSSAGTLTVEARVLEAGGPVPLLFSATSGQYRRQTLGPGTVSLLGVEAGQTYRLYVGVPEGSAPRRYTVSTSVQSGTSAQHK